MIPMLPLAGAGLLAWLLTAGKSHTVSSNTATGDLYAEGSNWREAALGTPPPSATLFSALVTRAVWLREENWAASNGKLYYKL